MTLKKSKILAAIMAVMILVNCSAVALAAQHTGSPLGGTWNWGERTDGGIKYAYSEYLLSYSYKEGTNGVHKTTVVGSTTDNSGWVDSGDWAKSKIQCKWNYVEKCYYNAQNLDGNAIY